MTFSSPLRWGIIGCGDVTEVKSGPPYRLTDGFSVVAVMRRDPDKLADYARRHGVARTYTDAAALIRDTEVDAVYIATPPDTHHLYALQVAAAGKPCCVEKPLAPTYAESVEIRDAFVAADVPLFVAYYRRSLPRFERVRQWLEEGAIGAVRHVSWILSRPPSEQDRAGTPNWRTDPKVAPAGYFDDLASHGLDLFAHYFGPYATVTGYGRNQQGLYGALDALTGSWVHASGVTGSGCWNFGTQARTDRVEIFGSTGTIRFAVFAEAAIELDAGDRQAREFIPHPHHVQQPHVERIAQALFTDAYVHPSTGETGAHTSWVMDRIVGRTP